MSDENHKDAKHAGYDWETSDKCGGHGNAKPAAAGLRSPNGFVGRLGAHGFKVAKGRKLANPAGLRGGNFHLSRLLSNDAIRGVGERNDDGTVKLSKTC
jgi:hypothetical protein